MEKLKTTDLRQMLRCSQTTLERWIRAGKIPAPIQMVAGGTRLWLKSEIDQIFNRNTPVS